MDDWSLRLGAGSRLGAGACGADVTTVEDVGEVGPAVSEIGDEVAVAWALRHLADQLLENAARGRGRDRAGRSHPAQLRARARSETVRAQLADGDPIRLAILGDKERPDRA